MTPPFLLGLLSILPQNSNITIGVIIEVTKRLRDNSGRPIIICEDYGKEKRQTHLLTLPSNV